MTSVIGAGGLRTRAKKSGSDSISFNQNAKGVRVRHSMGNRVMLTFDLYNWSPHFEQLLRRLSVSVLLTWFLQSGRGQIVVVKMGGSLPGVYCSRRSLNFVVICSGTTWEGLEMSCPAVKAMRLRFTTELIAACVRWCSAAMTCIAIVSSASIRRFRLNADGRYTLKSVW